MRHCRQPRDIDENQKKQTELYKLGKEYEAAGLLDEAFGAFVEVIANGMIHTASATKDATTVLQRQFSTELAIEFLVAYWIKDDPNFVKLLVSLFQASANMKKGLRDPLSRSLLVIHNFNISDQHDFSFLDHLTDSFNFLPNLTLLVFRSATSARRALKFLALDTLRIISVDRVSDLLKPEPPIPSSTEDSPNSFRCTHLLCCVSNLPP